MLSLSVLSTALIYTVFFDDLSETQLVQISPLWFLGLTLSSSGLIRERAIKLLLTKRASSFDDAMRQANEALSPLVRIIGGLSLLPARLVLPESQMTSPLVVSLTTAAGWALLLYGFFLGIFPSL